MTSILVFVLVWHFVGPLAAIVSAAVAFVIGMIACD